MLKKIINTSLLITVLYGCSSHQTIETVTQKETVNVLESKQRVFPKHLRNGVAVESASTWYLGEGASFKEVPTEITPFQNRNGWSLPEDEIQKYKKDEPATEKNIRVSIFTKETSEKTDTIPDVDTPNETNQDNLELFAKESFDTELPTVGMPSIKLPITNYPLTESLVSIDEVIAKAPPELKNEIPKPVSFVNQMVSTPPSLPISDTEKVVQIDEKIERKPIHKLDIKDTQIFEFEVGTPNLTNESRERLVHISPQSLIYRNITIESPYTNNKDRKNAISRNLVLKEELKRAGVKDIHIRTITKLNSEISNESSVSVNSKMLADTIDVRFDIENASPVIPSLLEIKDKVDPEKVEWVRIAAGSTGNPLDQALALKEILIKIGVAKEKINILHRQTKKASAKIYIYSALDKSLPTPTAKLESHPPEVHKQKEIKESPPKKLKTSKGGFQFQHNQKFVYEDYSNNLRKGSLTYLKDIAPHAAIYRNIQINAFYKTGLPTYNAYQKALKVKRELMKQGIRDSFIEIKLHETLQSSSEVHVDFSNKMKISEAEISFIGQLTKTTEESTALFLENFETSKVEWVQLISGNEGHPLDRALYIKSKLIEHGVDANKITILKRTTTERNLKSTIYLK